MHSQLAFDQVRFIMRFSGSDTVSYKTPNLLPFSIYLDVQDFMQQCTSKSKPGSKFWWPSHGGLKAIWPLSAHAKLVLTQGWNSKSKTAFVTFQINPSHLDSGAAADLLSVLATFLPAGYVSLVGHGRMSYVEIRFDINDTILNRFIVISTKARRVYDSFYVKGTLYLGGKNSGLQCKVYDKAPQLATLGVALGRDRLRVEVTLRHRNLTLDDLAALDNPFSSLVIVERDKLSRLKGHFYVDAFRRDITKGLSPQAAYMLSPDRAALVAGLNKVRPDWYEPDALGAALPALAASLSPEALQLIANTAFEVA